MKKKSNTRTYCARMKLTPDEHNFADINAWAQKLKLQDGRPLTAAQRREEGLARSVGRSDSKNT